MTARGRIPQPVLILHFLPKRAASNQTALRCRTLDRTPKRKRETADGVLSAASRPCSTGDAKPTTGVPRHEQGLGQREPRRRPPHVVAARKDDSGCCVGSGRRPRGRVAICDRLRILRRGGLFRCGTFHQAGPHVEETVEPGAHAGVVEHAPVEVLAARLRPRHY